MPIRPSKGNMYDWTDAQWDPLAGECLHKCSYCSTNSFKTKPPVAAKYSGEYRLVEHEMKSNLYKLGEGITIFVCSLSDLFEAHVPANIIRRVLEACNKYPKNTYVFQTKNPRGFWPWEQYFPPNTILGTTIETNEYPEGHYSDAPGPFERGYWMDFPEDMMNFKKFITIEPIMKFKLPPLALIIENVKPDFVNIGADSKNHGLPEPTWEEVRDLIEVLETYTEVRVKSNLERLRK